MKKIMPSMAYFSGKTAMAAGESDMFYISKS
jgi:hypothetical protein